MLTMTPRRRRMRKRLEALPAAHDCKIWKRRTRFDQTVAKTGLFCVVCGRP